MEIPRPRLNSTRASSSRIRAFYTHSEQWDASANLHGLLQEDGLAHNKDHNLIDTLHKTIEENMMHLLISIAVEQAQ